MLYPIECPDHDIEAEVTISTPMEETQGNDDDDNSEEYVLKEDVNNSFENGDDSAQMVPSTRPTR